MTARIQRSPKRVRANRCLTEETTEALYLMGEEWRIVGISGFTVRPARARKEKPKVSAFTTAKIDRILELGPDLVLGFSDLQAGIAAELIQQGIEVHVFNHRTVEGILRTIRVLGALIGSPHKGDLLAGRLERNLDDIRERASSFAVRPRVYFEEWYDPLISGIRWVSELVDCAGGEDCFPEKAREPLAKNRIIEDSLEVVRRSPDIIIGSWCGRKFRPEKVEAREAGARSQRFGRASCTRSSRLSSCSRVRQRSRMGVEAIQRIVERWVTVKSGSTAPPRN